jgi:hypothetical protein
MGATPQPSVLVDRSECEQVPESRSGDYALVPVRDRVVLALLLLGFAGFWTAHVLSIGRLAFAHRPRWRALVALVMPPLAPVWLWREGRRALPIAWALLLSAYLVGLAVSRLGG